MSATPISTDYVTGNTPLTRPENRAFYPALDGLRGVAFLMVFLWHYLSVPWMWAGVDVFFVLSGFLITGILYDTREARHRVRNFYVRRVLRIFPLYYGVLLFLLLLTPLFHWRWTLAWLCWPFYVGNWLYLFNPPMGSALWFAKYAHLRGNLGGHLLELELGHFWSLCVEEQFYLLWPWIVFRIRDRRALMWICFGCILGCELLRRIAFYFFPSLVASDALSHLTLFRVDGLMLGGLIALLLRGPSAQRCLEIGRRLWTPCFLAAFAWAFLLPPRLLKRSGYPMPGWTTLEGLLGLALLSGLLLLNLVEASGQWARVMRWPPLRFLGRLSYGLYVFHVILFGSYERIGRTGFYFVDKLIDAFFALAVTIALAWMSYRWFEAPFLNLKGKFTVRN